MHVKCSTLCFIIHVPESKKSNKSKCIDQYSMLRQQIKDVAITIFLSEGNAPILKDGGMVAIWIDPFRKQKRVSDWYKKLQFWHIWILCMNGRLI